jgi:hypothetical protein
VDGPEIHEALEVTDCHGRRVVDYAPHGWKCALCALRSQAGRREKPPIGNRWAADEVSRPIAPNHLYSARV